MSDLEPFKYSSNNGDGDGTVTASVTSTDSATTAEPSILQTSATAVTTSSTRLTKSERDKKRRRENPAWAKARDAKFHLLYRERRNAHSRAFNVQYRASDNYTEFKERRKTSIVSIINIFKSNSGTARGIEVTLTDDQIEALFRDNCYYCGDLAPDTFNGIDRVDSTVSYSPDNCVSCCSECNYMKFAMTTDDFLRAVRNVALLAKNKAAELMPLQATASSSVDVDCNWAFVYNFDGIEPGHVSHSTIVSNDQRKYGLETAVLTLAEFHHLSAQPCVYCDRPSSLSGSSIERIDSSIGHTTDNCVAACTRCNYMSKKMDESSFVSQCTAIARFYRIGDAISDSTLDIKVAWAPGQLKTHGTVSSRWYLHTDAIVKMYQPKIDNISNTVFVSMASGTAYHSIADCGRMKKSRQVDWTTLRGKTRPCFQCRANASVDEITRLCKKPLPGETADDIVAFWSSIRQLISMPALSWNADQDCCIETSSSSSSSSI